MKNLMVILSILVLISACNERKSKNSEFEEVVDKTINPYQDPYLMEFDEQENMVSPLKITNTTIGNSSFGSATMYDAKGNYYHGTTWNPPGVMFGTVNMYDAKGNYYHGSTWNPPGVNFGTVNMYDAKGNYYHGTTWNPNANTSNTFQNNNMQLPPRLPLPGNNVSPASNSSKDSVKKSDYWY